MVPGTCRPVAFMVVNNTLILCKLEAKGRYPWLSSDGVCICTHNIYTMICFLKVGSGGDTHL